MTDKKIRNDNGYENAFLGGARNRPRMGNFGSEALAMGGMFSELTLQDQYMHNGFARLICDKPAEEMTRAGFEIENLKDDLSQIIKSQLEELDTTKKFNEALKWRNAFGGGMIVLGLDDGGALNSPLNEDNLKAIKFMRVFDRFEVIVNKYNDNPFDNDFGEVEIYQINPRQGGTGFYVHKSRVLVFDGESIPNVVRVTNDGWGMSVIQKCYQQLINLNHSYRMSLKLLERMQQAVHSIPGLSDEVATPEGESLVRKRIGIVDDVRGLYNTVVIDGNEEYTVQGMSLTGIKDVLESHAEGLSAVSGHPTFILMGRTVGGLGGNGESSKEGWFAQIGAWQNDQARKPLDRLISLLILCNLGGKSDGGDYTLKFNPLVMPSEKDRSEVDYKDAQTDKVKADTFKVYLDAAVIDQDEVRKLIKPQYNLIGDAPEELPEAPKPMVLNPGQKIVDPTPGQSNPAITSNVGK